MLNVICLDSVISASKTKTYLWVFTIDDFVCIFGHCSTKVATVDAARSGWTSNDGSRYVEKVSFEAITLITWTATSRGMKVKSFDVVNNGRDAVNEKPLIFGKHSGPKFTVTSSTLITATKSYNFQTFYTRFMLSGAVHDFISVFDWYVIRLLMMLQIEPTDKQKDNKIQFNLKRWNDLLHHVIRFLSNSIWLPKLFNFVTRESELLRWMKSVL